MNTKVRNMTGQQLLLLRILGDASAQTAVEAERDRRALSSAPDRGTRRLGWAPALASPSPQMVA